jgi:hypothetical protein
MDLPVMLPVAPMLAKPVAQLPDGGPTASNPNGTGSGRSCSATSRSWLALLVIRRQELAKAAQPPKRAGLDRSQRNSQLGGDLGLGAVAEVGQP